MIKLKNLQKFIPLINYKKINFGIPNKNFLNQKKSFSTNNQNNTKNEENLGFFKKAKLKIKLYGTRGLVFYSLVYVANGFMFYFLFKYKFIKSDKFLQKINEYGIDKYLSTERIIKRVGKDNFDIICAVLLNEIFEVIRLPVVIMLIPKIFKKIK